MGETAARPRFFAEETAGGQRSPMDKSEEKTGTEVTDERKCNPTGSIIRLIGYFSWVYKTARIRAFPSPRARTLWGMVES